MAQTLSSATPTMWHDNIASSGDRRGIRGRPDWTDLLYFVLLAAGAAYALNTYSDSMDYYEKIILVGFVPFVAWLGWLWRPLRTITVACGLTALLAIWLYSTGGGLINGDIQKADSVFLLKYLLSSQSAILWMCALFVL
ncbi:MAG: c-type cytochrome biogenesis protein CcsB, partial [Alcaligenes sp.]